MNDVFVARFQSEFVIAVAGNLKTTVMSQDLE
jgi:hypothetical protein